MPGQERVHDLRNDRVLVADDAGEERPAVGEAREQVRTDLIANWPAPEWGLTPGTDLEVVQRAWLWHCDSHSLRI